MGKSVRILFGFAISGAEAAVFVTSGVADGVAEYRSRLTCKSCSIGDLSPCACAVAAIKYAKATTRSQRTIFPENLFIETMYELGCGQAFGATESNA